MRQRRGVRLGFALVACALLQGAAGAGTLYVSPKGDNGNDGSRERPFKEIDRALKAAKAGDVVQIAGGTYRGSLGLGFLESDKPVQLRGGYSEDFAQRDPIRYPSLVQPDNAAAAKARKPLLAFSRAVEGAVVDGLVFDMGERNSYDPKEGRPEGVASGMLLLAPAKAPGQNATASEPCLSIPSAAAAGSVTIKNNVFVNCASFGVQAGQRGGTYRIVNNVFAANRMGAVEVYGTCAAKGGPKGNTRCGEVEVGNNSIVFTWSRLKDFLDMGHGVRVMTKLGYDIHHNVVGASVAGGIDHSRFNPGAWVKVDNNVFFANKGGDVAYSPQGNVSIKVAVAQFGDLDVASRSGNRAEVPKALKLDRKYLEGFLAARYSEQADYDPSSPANQLREVMGLNKQGKLKTQVSMFANRYPWQAALELFGNLADAGAQVPRD
jgi:hypothetical protein